ncbi:MAG: hypothetical protein Q8L88_00330 [Bacteroidota bacterium]|nr:hypothetical protein [Bacteroidota bacterium]
MIVLITFSVTIFAQQSFVNFSHIEHLSERIYLSGDSVSIIRIYADYPSYNWVDASSEGITCVDDAARTAVAYLRHYELTKNAVSKNKAKEYLKFVIKLQAEDGQFYNFIYADHSINRDGKTSFKSFGWWAARGVWCFGLGYRIFEKEDPQFAALLKTGIEKTFVHIDTLLHQYGKKKEISGYAIPQWLLYESGSDATTELVLGLTEYYTATADTKVRSYIEKFCDGMMQMQSGDIRTYPFGLHRSWETMWHAWGNGQTQALAQAGKVLKNKTMIASAQREAEGFYSRLLIQGFKREFDVADSSKKREFEQIAYDIRPMVIGLIRLYEATNDKKYLTMAQIAGSWFFGNNAVNVQMYDPLTGRCFDGIHSYTEFNKNSGAESTIEALNAIIELEQYDKTNDFSKYRRTNSGENKKFIFAIYSNGNDEAGLVIDKKQGSLSMMTGKPFTDFKKKNLK